MTRRIRAVLAALAVALAASPALAQPPQLVRVPLAGPVTLRALLEGGFDLVEARAGGAQELLLWPGDDARLAAFGASWTVLDRDPGRSAAERSRRELAARAAAPGAARPALAQFAPALGGGAVGGFWSLDEVKQELDALVAGDVNGVVADRLDTLGWTIQHRPIWALTIGKPPAGPDTRPVVFMNALAHAREPEGMQALFYYVENLLARYPSDPEAKYLLEHRRLVICPVENPDGYRFNQQIYDSTGAFGMWRKNLRDTNGDHKTLTGDGVDLNRNFGFEWGADNIGSSGTTTNETYRGTAPFSEPETQAQRDEVDALQPVTGLSFHTYGDLLLCPWGWTPAASADSMKFYEWADAMNGGNGYSAGQSTRVLYEVNGEFNDWTYGDTLLKPRAYTWTPEVGGPDDGFWPPPSRMEPLARDQLAPCEFIMGIAGPWVRVGSASVVEGELDAGRLAHLVVRARDVGQTGTAGPGLRATLAPLDPRVDVLVGAVDYPTLAPFTGADPLSGGTFVIAAADTVTPGTPVRFLVTFTDDAGLCSRDTVTLVVGAPTTAYRDDGESLAPWSPLGAPWSVVTHDPAHPSAYLTDSPAGTYPIDQTASLTLVSPLDLSAGARAYVLLDEHYGYESGYDCGVLEASLDGAAWTALPGSRTTTSEAASRAGAGVQVLTGTRWLWGADRFDLAGFAGGGAASAVRLRWRSLSDAGTNLDGIAFDSLRVVVYDPAAQPAPVAVGDATAPAALAFAPPAPNPARARVRLSFALPAAGPVRLEMLDVQGRLRWTRDERLAAGRYAWGWDLRDRAGPVAPGVYLARLVTPSGALVRRFVVMP